MELTMGFFDDYAESVPTSLSRGGYIEEGVHTLSFLGSRARESDRGKGMVYVLEFRVETSDTMAIGSVVNFLRMPDHGDPIMKKKRVGEIMQAVAAVQNVPALRADVDAMFENGGTQWVGSMVSVFASTKTTKGGGRFTTVSFSPLVQPDSDIPF